MQVNKAIWWDLSRPLESHCTLQFFDFDSKEGRRCFWNSSALILAQALEIEFPTEELCRAHVLEEGGFYYDCRIDTDSTIKDDKLKLLEKQARNIIKQNQSFERLVLSKSEAIYMFQDNVFKLEIIHNKIPDGGFCTAYRCGDFIDLSTGPHVPNTAFITIFSLTKTSSCYWKGDATQSTLQRVYGISFPDDHKLEEHERIMREAEERDHRKIGLVCLDPVVFLF